MTTLIVLLSRDGLRTAALEAIFTAHHQRSGFARELVSAAAALDPEYGWRPIWLLRRLARERGELAPAVLSRLARLAPEVDHWLGRLSLCQLFALCPCPPEARENLFPTLEDCFADKRVIVRAWALTAAYWFRHDKTYAGAVNQMLQAACQDGRASMQARLKHLAEGGGTLLSIS